MSQGNIKTEKLSLVAILIKLFPIILVSSPILLLVTIFLSIFHGGSFALSTIVTQKFFDAITHALANQTSVTVVIWMALALGGVVIGSQVLNGAHNFIGKTYMLKMMGHLTRRIHEKASRIEPIAYESPELLNDINKANEGMVNSLGLLFTVLGIFTFYFPYFLFMGVYMYTLKPLLTLSIMFVFIPVALTHVIRASVFSRLEDESAPLRREFDYYERCIGDREYFKETRLLGAFAFFHELYQTALLLLGKKIWKAEFKTRMLELGMRMMTLAGYFGILYLLFYYLLSGEISIGSFAAIFASIGMMFGLMEEVIGSQIGEMTKNLGSVRNFIRFLELPEREGKDVAIDAGNGVILENVSFRYPGAEVDALSDVSFELKKGETVAIVGENGAGKTTLVKLMTGLYLPTKGSVKIDGWDTKEISKKSIYSGISSVFQKFQRYQMTVKENIKMSELQKEEDEELLKFVAEKADLDMKQTTFPDGFETMLSREFGGVDLSIGQWQRVAIARGFYRAHSLIVLDEPTAAIDPVEETRIFHKFAELAKDKTAIIVTHRLGLTKIVDRIVVMDQGKIVEVGTHDELMGKGGKYAEMYHAQSKWYVVNQ